MQKRMILVALILFLAGCAKIEEAYYVDREFGKHSQAAWDAQVLHPDYPYADLRAEGLAGIAAEEIMSTHNQTFAEKPTKAKVYEFGLGGAQ